MRRMCGRFSQGEPSHRISDYFGAYPDDDLPEGLYNVPPTETIRMVVEREGERRLTAAKWGFRPFWADRVDGSRRSWINARAETAAISPAFGPALRTHRCVIPADAFYEWDRATSPRQHGALPSVAILTTRPNALVERIHNRMPVILDRELLDAWLDPAATLADVEPMLAPASEASVRIWPVGSAVNRVGTDGPELLERVEVPRTLGLV
jgi:putative SOS response-associated peptidase YedK